MDGTVLVADDDRAVRTVLTQALTRAGCRVRATPSMETLLRWVAEGEGDLVVSDVVMPDGDGLEALPRIAEERPGLPVIVISARNTIVTAIRAAELDAFDYLPKPFDLPELLKRAARALAAGSGGDPAGPAAGDEPEEELPLVGRSPAMQTLYRLVARSRNADLPMLIAGEAGSGKTSLARAIHEFSDRSARPLAVAAPGDLGCADSVESLIRSADGGAILLDGVADLDWADQMRAIGMIDMLEGLPDPAPRIMATGPASIARLVESGGFRPELYYRLSGVILQVPPLRERVEDIPLIAGHFLIAAERDGLPRRSLSGEATDFLRACRWPGNVRQLENAIRLLAATSSEEEIQRSEAERALEGQPESEPLASDDGELADAVARHIRRLFDLSGDALPQPGLHRRVLREIEAPLIEIALDATGGNQARCAELLGINRNTLRSKLTDLGMDSRLRRRLS